MRGREGQTGRKTEIEKQIHLLIPGFAEHHELLFPDEGTRTQGVHCLKSFLQLLPFLGSVYLPGHLGLAHKSVLKYDL